jgi:hypothetical protein
MLDENKTRCTYNSAAQAPGIKPTAFKKLLGVLLAVAGSVTRQWSNYDRNLWDKGKP